MFKFIKELVINHKKTVIAISIPLMVFIGYLNDLHGFYNNYIKQKRAEDGLVLLNTGVSIQHVKSVFGAPITERKNKEKNVSEYIYSFKNFYLQVVYNNENEVVFYSVTSKSKGFTPKIPFLKKQLGNTFEEISDHYSYNEANWSSKFFEYNENIYLGNFGNYRNIYLAYNPAGIEYQRGDMLPFDEMPRPSKEASQKYRKVSYPNTFGVGSSHGGRDDVEVTFGVGIEYFSSRDLPSHIF